MDTLKLLFSKIEEMAKRMSLIEHRLTKLETSGQTFWTVLGGIAKFITLLGVIVTIIAVFLKK